MDNEHIRVGIADDHGVVRAGIRSLLIDSGLDVVGEARNGREAVILARETIPDVMLLDIRMPDMDGLRALAAIKSENPQISVIMLTTYANPEYLARAVSLGAAGYLSKEVDPQRIPRAVRAAATGDSLLDRDLLLAALKSGGASVSNHTKTAVIDSQPPSLPAPSPEPTELPTEELTEQETTILKLIVSGLNNNAIADSLSISTSTVKTHVRHIFRKLGVSDRTQAAVWAMRHGVAQ